MSAAISQDELLTVKEAARRSGVSRAAIYQAVREGRLTAVPVTGGGVVLSSRQVREYVPRTRRQPKSGRQDRSVWDKIGELGKEISLEEWENVPSDASINLEHYLYGAPRVGE